MTLSENDNYLIKNKTKLIDPIYLINRFGIFSTIKNDPLFWNNQQKNPIFCAGKIIDFEQNVFNLQKKEIVGYISYDQDLNLTLSPNLIFKIKEKNTKLISIIPYASYAMKILRKIDPKIGENIVIIGYNFFSLLLFKLLKLSGANVFIIKFKEKNQKKYIQKNNIGNFIIEGIKHINKFLKNTKIKNIILISEINEELNVILLNNSEDFYKRLNLICLYNLNNSNLKEKLEINTISPFDIGYNDLNYIKGVKYPYSYIRWDYKRNLKYFIYLIENKTLNIDFLDIIKINVNSIEDIKRKINFIQEEAIFLFQIQN